MRIGHAGNDDAVDALRTGRRFAVIGRRGIDFGDEPLIGNGNDGASGKALRQKNRLQTIATHVGYTCIGNRLCRIIRATAIGGRSVVQKSSGKEWDQVWIGADIATMVAGTGPYGNIKNAGLGDAGE